MENPQVFTDYYLARLCSYMNNFLGNSQFRKSFAGGPVSPEQPWLAPETFACLETFGAGNKEDLPYEIFGLGANETGLDRVAIL